MSQTFFISIFIATSLYGAVVGYYSARTELKLQPLTDFNVWHAALGNLLFFSMSLLFYGFDCWERFGRIEFFRYPKDEIIGFLYSLMGYQLSCFFSFCSVILVNAGQWKKWFV